MTDLSYSHGQLAKNWLRWHGLGYLPNGRDLGQGEEDTPEDASEPMTPPGEEIP